MNIFGHNFRLAIWGESHGQQIGISIDGIPAGVPLSPPFVRYRGETFL